MQTKLERIKKDIEALSEFNATPGQGLTRFSLTEEDRQARNYLKNQLKKLNLEVYEDAAGSLFARRSGSSSKLPVIMIGSHFDSVKNGGNFDGPAGVVMALEILRTLDDNNIQTTYPIEFVAMIEEEGGRFGAGVFGSRAMAGMVDYEQLKNNTDENGISMAEAFDNFGMDPKKIINAKRDPSSIKAFIELHIEQGPVLESKKKDIGIVNYIVGINHIDVVIHGRSDHAGTTPMLMRADAMSVASKVISKIDGYAIAEDNGTVATVGSLDVKPGATNIVPSQVKFTVDIRSKDYKSIETVKEKIQDDLNQLINTNDAMSFEIVTMLDIQPVEMSEEINQHFKASAASENYAYEMMTSGAGHDAMIMGSLTDVGLIFVPSKNGRSHCPEEWTDYEDLQKGIEVIYQTILKLGEAD